MFDTESDIIEAIKEKEGSLEALHTRMEEDYDLYRLAEYEADKGYESYTSSAPRNFFDKVLDGVNRAALTMQIKLPEDASEKERKAASHGEMYLYGALQEIDRQHVRQGQPALRESLAFYMCLRGWYALRALVYTPRGADQPVFDVTAWDPLHVTWEWGPEGLLWAAHKRKASKAQIEAEYGLVIGGKDAEVIDFFDTERNGVIVENSFVKRPTAHNIGHVPVLVGPVGSMPDLQTQFYDVTTEYRGDSVWAAARGLYEPWNKHVSTIMDLHERSKAGSLVHKSLDGRKEIKGDPYKSYQEISIAQDEEIKPLELAEPPPQTAAILGIISGDLQQSTLPYPLAYGGTTQAMSGMALSILSEATRSVYSPRTEALAKVYQWLGEELVRQFQNKGSGERRIKGYDAKGKFFAVAARPGEMNEDWFLDVTCEPVMPRDEEKDIMMALSAMTPRTPDTEPLVSVHTAREDILRLKDADAEADKVLEEKGERFPPIQVRKIARALMDRGKPEMAQEIMAMLGPQQPQQLQLPEELVEAVVAELSRGGQSQLAAGLLQALGIGQRGPQVLQGAPPGEEGVTR